MIVASHRGPVSFRHEDDGSFTTRRGAGGVVSALAPLLRNRPDTRWMAAAIGPDNRAAVTAGAPVTSDINVELQVLDPELHRMHYDVISNRVLWFLFHGLFDLPREPSFGRSLHEAWDAFHAVNATFAAAIADSAADGEVVLVQDLHLLLVPGLLHAARPDLGISYFTHTPFCGPSSMGVLPDTDRDPTLRVALGDRDRVPQPPLGQRLRSVERPGPGCRCPDERIRRHLRARSRGTRRDRREPRSGRRDNVARRARR